jgi:Zn-dependent peptidase ImmA (M78 family)
LRIHFLERSAPPEWNCRVLTEDDFWFYCNAFRVFVHEVPLERLGVHFSRPNHGVIFINDRLRGVERQFVLWHELGHHLLHPPGIQFFQGYGQQVEQEADAFAACALVPRSLLQHYWPSELTDLYGYPADLVELRQSLFDVWGL